MPKKAKPIKKNEIKQKQTQKQIVNVNINQSKTTKKENLEKIINHHNGL